MGEYMRTLLNGLKAWVGGEISKLRAKIEAVATAASKTASLAAKNKTDIAGLGQGLNEAAEAAENAQTTANAAQTTAVKTNASSKIVPDSRYPYNAIEFYQDASSPKISVASVNETNTKYGTFIGKNSINVGHSSASSSGSNGEITLDASQGIPRIVLTIVNRGISAVITMNTDRDIVLGATRGIVIASSSADSTKKFRITVNDSGTLSATEVTS